MTTPPPIPPGISASDFAHFLDVIAAGKTFLCVMLSILLWDTLATFPDEWRYIWKARWTPIKVLFLINRYWTIVLMGLDTWMIASDSVPSHICRRISRLQPGGAMVTLIACSGILTIRVWALFEKSRKVLISLLTLVVLELGILAMSTSQFRTVGVPPQFHICFAAGAKGGSGFVIAFWAAPLIFDTVILGMTVFRVFQIRKRGGTLPILKTFLADAGLYYSVIFVVDFVNIVFYAQPDPVIQPINNSTSLVLTSLMASRIVLHLHASQRSPNSSGHSDPPKLPSFIRSRHVPPTIARPPRAHSRSFMNLDFHLDDDRPTAHQIALKIEEQLEMDVVEKEKDHKRRMGHRNGSASSGSLGGIKVRVDREVVKVVEREDEGESLQ